MSGFKSFGDRTDYALFNEMTPRVVISCDVDKVNPVIQTAISKQLDVSVIGWTTDLENEPKLSITHKNREVIYADLIDLKHEWRHACEPLIGSDLKIAYLEDTDPEGNPVHLWWSR